MCSMIFPKLESKYIFDFIRTETSYFQVYHWEWQSLTRNLEILTVCFIIGALCLFPAPFLGCLSIDGGSGLSLAGTIGSFSLRSGKKNGYDWAVVFRMIKM